MKKPENVSDSGNYPKVLSFLSEAIIQLKGAESEGIFRVPGDLDQIIHLQMQIDSGVYELGEVRDPAVPASLLKQWTRELAEPLIPNAFYNRCLTVEDKVEEAMEIVDELPELNRNALKYLVKFLQVIGNPNFQLKTKMTVSNLSLVFAPNLLRCPSDNPIKFLADSKKQANFLKLLVNYMR
jgi:Rho GTPase-activating protein 39